MRIAIDTKENTIDHRILNVELLALGIPGFQGTASLIREEIDGRWVACPRYVLIKATEEVPVDLHDQVTTVVLVHAHREIIEP